MTRRVLASVRERQLLFDLLWRKEAEAADGDGSLSDDEWGALDLLARQHRLRPLLHDRYGRAGPAWNVPEDIAERWRRAHRRSGLRAMAQRRDLARIDRWFEAAGIAGFALKGSAIIWRGWFDPALRPMRDIDILVGPDDGLAAYELLREHGFIGPALTTPPDERHFPGLTEQQSRSYVEIHTHLIEAYDGEGTRQDENFCSGAIARAGTAAARGGIHQLTDTDNLLHVVLHGVLDHQLNIGPLFLLDVSTLIGRGDIDWSGYWARAHDADGVRASQVAFMLARRVDPGLAINWQRHAPEDLEPRVLDSAMAMLQIDLERLTELGAPGRLLRLTNNGRLKRLVRFARRGPVNTGNPRHAGSLARRIVAVLLRFGAALTRRDDRRYLRQTVTVANWLRAR